MSSKEYMRQWRLDNSARVRECQAQWKHDNAIEVQQYNRQHRLEQKLKVLTHYGLRCPLYGEQSPRCMLCGEARIGALNIDHINGGGQQHLIEINNSEICQWLYQQYLKNSCYPDGYRTLCANCNVIEYLKTLKLLMTASAIKSRNTDSRSKQKAMLMIGCGICACAYCGCNDIRVLDIHHPNNDGNEHRLEIGNKRRGRKFYNVLSAPGYHTNRLMVVACRSCNMNIEYERHIP